MEVLVWIDVFQQGWEEVRRNDQGWENDDLLTELPLFCFVLGIRTELKAILAICLNLSIFKRSCSIYVG